MGDFSKDFDFTGLQQGGIYDPTELTWLSYFDTRTIAMRDGGGGDVTDGEIVDETSNIGSTGGVWESQGGGGTFNSSSGLIETDGEYYLQQTASVQFNQPLSVFLVYREFEEVDGTRLITLGNNRRIELSGDDVLVGMSGNVRTYAGARKFGGFISLIIEINGGSGRCISNRVEFAGSGTNSTTLTGAQQWSFGADNDGTDSLNGGMGLIGVKEGVLTDEIINGMNQFIYSYYPIGEPAGAYFAAGYIEPGYID